MAKKQAPAAPKAEELGGPKSVPEPTPESAAEHDEAVQKIVDDALAKQAVEHEKELTEAREQRVASTSHAKQKAALPAPAQTEPIAASAPPSQRIKVRATKLGYYDHKRKRIGDVFWIAGEHHFSDAHRTKGPPGWMEKVPVATPERQTTGKQQLRKEHDEILAASRPPMVEEPDSEPTTGDTDVMGDTE